MSLDQSLRGVMRGICCNGNGSVELRRMPIPTPGPGEVLIRVHVAAQNPMDVKMMHHYKKDGAVLGCDFAGVIIELGSDPPSNVTVGNRVAGFVHGGTESNGSFAEYVVAAARTLLRVPESWSFEDAAQIGLTGYTACQCLYQVQSLPTPFDPATEPVDLLVWGGTTAVGHVVIQLALMSGMRVITTASPRYAEQLKSVGVTEVFDYRDPKVGQKIRNFTKGQLNFAVDCVSEETTPFQVSDALSMGGGTISTVLPYTSRKSGVTTVLATACLVIGHICDFPFVCRPDDTDRVFSEKALGILNRLLAAGSLKPIRKKLYLGGLTSVFDGLTYMSDGKVSAEKVTYVLIP